MVDVMSNPLVKLPKKHFHAIQTHASLVINPLCMQVTWELLGIMLFDNADHWCRNDCKGRGGRCALYVKFATHNAKFALPQGHVMRKMRGPKSPCPPGTNAYANGESLGTYFPF